MISNLANPCGMSGKQMLCTVRGCKLIGRIAKDGGRRRHLIISYLKWRLTKLFTEYIPRFSFSFFESHFGSRKVNR